VEYNKFRKLVSQSLLVKSEGTWTGHCVSSCPKSTSHVWAKSKSILVKFSNIITSQVEI